MNTPNGTYSNEHSFHRRGVGRLHPLVGRRPKATQKINDLIKDIKRHPFTGIGKPEPLRYSDLNAWSRRIDREHRLVYVIKDDVIIIQQARFHY